MSLCLPELESNKQKNKASGAVTSNLWAESVVLSGLPFETFDLILLSLISFFASSFLFSNFLFDRNLS